MTYENDDKQIHKYILFLLLSFDLKNILIAANHLWASESLSTL